MRHPDNHPIGLPLRTGTVFNTNSVDDALVVAQKQFADMEFRFKHADMPFEYVLAMRRVGGMELLAHEQRISGGSELLVRPISGAHSIEIPLFGANGIATAGQEASVRAGHSAAIISASESAKWRDSGQRYRAINVQVSQEKVVAQIEALSGRTVCGPVIFDPVFDMTTPVGSGFRQLIEQAFMLADGPGSLLDNPVAAAAYEDLLVASLVTQFGHSFSHLLTDPQSEAGSQAVRDAETYMRQNLDAPITMKDVAAAAGVSIRSLQRSFRSERETSPMRWLKDIRLDRAHQRLSLGDPASNVTQVAFLTGFTHLGAFSADYRKRFDETPSQTFQRSRR